MNNKEIQTYQAALQNFNPFYGVEFPITSIKLTDIINKMRNDHNEKVVELRHDNLMVKIKEYEGDGLNFQVIESLYKDSLNRDKKCYLLGKTECRILAASESKTICCLIMVYLDQLEQIFEKAIKDKAAVFDRKLAKQGITWREACRAVGIDHPDLAIEYMIERGYLKRSFDGGLLVRPRLLNDKSFKVADNLGFNKEGFRVLTNGFKKLQNSAESINWQCLKFSNSPRLQAIYKAKHEAVMKTAPKVVDEHGYLI